MSTVELTKDNFAETIENNDVVLVDFWADWCGPCKAFAPVFEKAAEQHENIVFGKVDTEAQRELAAAFRIRAIPTLMVFREQVMLFNEGGALRGPHLEQLIDQVMALDMDEVRAEIAKQEAEHEHGAGD